MYINLKINRLDHHGIVSGVIEDLKIVSLLDQYLPQDDKQEITPGEAVKGMIMNGLGFANRPLLLSPHFLLTCRLNIYFVKGVKHHILIDINSVELSTSVLGLAVKAYFH